MNLREKYAAELRDLRANDPEYQAEELILAVSAALRKRMAAEKINQAELAKRLKVSRAYISQLLKDERANITLKKLAKLAFVLNARVVWDFKPLKEVSESKVNVWECKPVRRRLVISEDFQTKIGERQDVIAFAA